jgi:hypothetical protein
MHTKDKTREILNYGYDVVESSTRETPSTPEAAYS